MSNKLVLVTGASGHLGFRVVVNALEAGYDVRAAVRSQSKADTILSAASIKALAPKGRLQFILVPEIIVDGAYDEAVRGADYVIHTASALPFETDDHERDVLEPALKGTTGILGSASKAPSVKRIVITSSIVAVMPRNQETDTTLTADGRIPDSHGPFSNPFEAYCAAKANALNATDAFVQNQRPQFDVINVMPTFFIGKSELITSPKDIIQSTSGFALGPILGQKSDNPRAGVQIHADDVAKVHVLSLNPKVKGNQNFGMTSGGVAGNQW